MDVGMIAAGLALQLLLWGAGLAWLVMPRRWRRFWPVLIPAAGLALQSAVVWAGAHAGVAGTDALGRASLGLPLALLGWAVVRAGAGRLVRELARWSGIAALALAVVVAAALTLARGGAGATTVSLGSCDAADYVAGARVLQEFPRHERAGFLGQTEVVAVGGVDNFPDYWLRLNHFTPAALLALNATLLGRPPHTLPTLHTGLLLAALLPAVFWASRTLLRLRPGWSLLVAAAGAVSPLWWYAVAHVAPAQLLAAQGVVWLTWAGAVLARGGAGRRRWLPWGGVLVAAYWLMAGSYNFFLVACLAPGAGWAVWVAWSRRDPAALARWATAMALPLGVVALAAPARFLGLEERFRLLLTHDFGWRIPLLTLEGWFGLVATPELSAWPSRLARLLAIGVLAALWIWAAWPAVRRRRDAWAAAGSILAPVVAGFGFLHLRGHLAGTNASYDAYKLLAVFYPLVLPALWAWTGLAGGGAARRRLAAVAAAGLLAGGALASGRILTALARPPLWVTPELADLRHAEDPAALAGGVNLRVPDMWSRLWANAFLLRVPQYFETPTYEARRDTPLRGRWDLVGGVVTTEAAAVGGRALSPRFALVPAGGLRVEPAEGWFPVEHAVGSPGPSQWTGREAVIEVRNPGPGPVTLTFTLEAFAWGPRTLTLRRADGGASGGPRALGQESARVAWTGLEAPPGASRWVLASAEPARPAGPGDPRLLAVRVSRLTVSPAGR